MATLTVQNITLAGIVPSYVAVAASDEVPNNDGKIVLRVINDGASTDTVTVVGSGQCNCGYLHDQTIEVVNGQSKFTGPFPVDHFGTTVTVNHSYTTSVTIGTFRLPPAMREGLA